MVGVTRSEGYWVRWGEVTQGRGEAATRIFYRNSLDYVCIGDLKFLRMITNFYGPS